MEYLNKITQNNATQSIDMVVLELSGAYPNFEKWLSFHKIEYQKGDVKSSTKFGNYTEYINFCGVSIEFGADVGGGTKSFISVDDDGEEIIEHKKTVVTYPKCRIRFNPNKTFKYPWFMDEKFGFCHLLNTWAQYGKDNIMLLKKYDIACDVNVPISLVNVRTRKEPHTFKGTRYYGARENTHGYLKIYDKKAERKKYKDYSVLDDDLTRIEYTWNTEKERCLDDIRFSLGITSADYSALNDTERAIVEMYNKLCENEIDYDLKLGRYMTDKLKDYLFCDKQIVRWFDDELLKQLQTIINFQLPTAYCINNAFSDYKIDCL